MRLNRLAHWLAILAITLQAAWPLIAAAKPRAVALVPVCTVDGTTHYLEVPTGKLPLEDSANGQHGHCAFCFLGMAGLLPSHVDVSLRSTVGNGRIAPGVEDSRPAGAPITAGARAPPFSPVVIIDHNFGRQSETDLFAGRVARAPYSERFMWVGVLHGRHAVEYAGSDD